MTTDAEPLPPLLPVPRRLVPGRGHVRTQPPREVRVHDLPAQGYRLHVGMGPGEAGAEVVLECSGDAGAFYGRLTLAQLEVPGGRLPVCTVEDWPDHPVRGVMVDISRDKVPTLDTLKALVDRLAALKVNHLQLYMEHTFAYAGHEVVWADATPFTAADVAELDRWCRDRRVELVPNQNCLGHLERWLRHERYRHLAIAPDGFELFGRRHVPMTIDPAHPGSLALVRDLLGQLVPCFGSKRVHVGLDEPFELARERVGDYLGHVRALRELPELAGSEVLIWGDIVSRHPEVLHDLPAGVTICEWGYEADHDFGVRAARLAAAGRPFWLCPGTSSWNSLVGRTTNALANQRVAAEEGAAHGADGYLVTDWGDNGHLQPLPVSEPLLAHAAAVSWCAEANRPDPAALAAAVDRHVFRDGTGQLSAALLALGDAHTLVEPQLPNMSVLCAHLYFPGIVLGERRTAGLTDADLERAAVTVDDALASAARSRPARPDGSLIRDEVAWAGRLLRLLIDDARARLAVSGRLADVPEQLRSGLAGGLDGLIAQHRELWLGRNRAGGLDDSAAVLKRLAASYRAP